MHKWYMIRKAELKDIEGMTNLLFQLFSIEKDFSFDRNKHMRGLSMLLEERRSTILIAESKGEVIGMCTMQYHISTAEGGGIGIIEDLIIDSRFRGKGIGISLLQNIEDIARDAGYMRIQLLADKNNGPALKFYKKNRWKHTELVCLFKKEY